MLLTLVVYAGTLAVQAEISHYALGHHTLHPGSPTPETKPCYSGEHVRNILQIERLCASYEQSYSSSSGNDT